MKPIDIRRILRISGMIALPLLYLIWWVGMIGDPIQRSGADFISFYAVGRAAQTHGYSSVYDVDLQRQMEQGIEGIQLTTDEALLYIHPPYLIPLLAWIVDEEYAGSFSRWVVILLGVCLAGSLILITALFSDTDRNTRLTLTDGALTFLPLFIGLRQGQDSAFLFFGAALWFAGMLKEKNWLAGIGLALTTIRPHVTIVLAIPLLLRHRKTFRRFFLAASVLTGISLWMLGSKGTMQYIHLLSISAKGEWFGIDPLAMLNLFGYVFRAANALHMDTPAWTQWVIYVAGIAGLIALWRRSQTTDETLLGANLLIAVLIAPHLFFHDLILLIFPLLVIAKRGMTALDASKWPLLPMGGSLVLLIGLGWREAYFIIVLLTYAGLTWLLWAPLPRRA